MRIALAGIRIKAGRLDENFLAIKSEIDNCRKSNVDLIVFPEMCISGYLVGDSWERDSFLRDCAQLGEDLAALSNGIHIIFGNVYADWNCLGEDGRTRKYNAAFLASNGKLVFNSILGMPCWPKTLLPNYREFDDSRHFYDLRKLALERATKIEDLLAPMCVEVGGREFSFGVGICEDAWDRDYGISVFEKLSKKTKLAALININSSPYTYGKRERRERTFADISRSVSLPFFHVNCVGTQNIGKTIYGFDGGSGVILPAEGVVRRAAFFAEETVFVEWDSVANGVSFAKEFWERKSLRREAELIAALEAIVRYICEEWRIKRVVIGASGGIDSTLSAVLFSRVLGSKQVFLINMPSRFNSELTKGAARDLAVALGCPYAVQSIEEGSLLTQREIAQLSFGEENPKPELSSFVYENIQARDRGGRVLAAVAASLGAVFTCNANKSELTIGYSTLYGDQAGFVAALGDLWKHDIYALSRYYNEEIFGREVIPAASLEVVPSAELSAEQDVLQGKGDPLNYPYHDYLFKSWVERWDRKTPYDILVAYEKSELEKLIGCEAGLVSRLFPSAAVFIADLERWWQLYQGMGVVKRVQAPPVIALSQRAFGFDHREALGLLWTNRQYEELRERLLISGK